MACATSLAARTGVATMARIAPAITDPDLPIPIAVQDVCPTPLTVKLFAWPSGGECHLHAWDVAAGLLLVEEAGGRITDFEGAPPPRSGERLVASNGPLHPIMLEILG